MKTLRTLSFVEGALSIKSSGYGRQNGWAELVFDEDQIEFRSKEEKTGSYAVVEIAHSELIALRDFLNETLPLAPCDDSEFGSADSGQVECPSCRARRDNCRLCGGRGVVTEQQARDWPEAG